MKRFLTLFVSLSFISPFHLALAQTGAPQNTFTLAFNLVQKGQLDAAVPVLKKEAEAADRTDAERGRAYVLLGYAYKEEGRFEIAQRMFDRAFRLMDASSEASRDYTAALDFYADLLMSMGNFDSAERALHEAASLDMHLANHVGLAKIYTHTAELDITRKKYRQAKRELASARVEAALAGASGTPMSPDIDSTNGWLATSTRKFHDAVTSYSAALHECQEQFGEKSVLTGWSYLLLGKSEQLDRDVTGAARNMDKGLEILRQTVGTNNIRYLSGELAYSELLDETGSHIEAHRISSAANQSLDRLRIQQCAGCTVSVWSLRHEGQ